MVRSDLGIPAVVTLQLPFVDMSAIQGRKANQVRKHSMSSTS